MTRKRIGQGLLEAFSETCDHCKGRGVIVSTEPVPERSRASVAEKVRAVAARTRVAATEDGGRLAVDADEANLAEVALADAGFADPTLVDDELAESTMADLETDADRDAADFAVELAAAGEGPSEDETEQPSARRRARRGSSRRRTRP
jgi:ribonuclease E